MEKRKICGMPRDCWEYGKIGNPGQSEFELPVSPWPTKSLAKRWKKPDRRAVDS